MGLAVEIRPLLVLVGGYLLGSIPFSFLVARHFGVADVRTVGSGNVGATNVMRSAGKGAGLLAFLLDALKGGAAAILAARLEPVGWLAPLAAAAAVLGHMYPLWLGFRGGKGVATGAGAFLPLAPLATGLSVAVFAATLGLTRYVSLSSIAGSLGLALFAFLLGAPPPVAWTGAAIAALIVWRHRSNLERIAKGTESRLGRPRS